MAFSHLSAVSVILALTSQTVSASPVQHRSIFKRAASGPWFTDFPDPGLIQGDDGNFYSFATNSGGYHIPTAFSTDGIGGNWQYIANDTDATRQWDALPVLPSWQPVENQQIWAPDVARMPDGRYSMLFCNANVDSPNPASPDDPGTNFFCLGIGFSDNAYGPFEATDAPVVCDDPGQGVIDPAHFTDTDGTLYYLWRRASRAAIFIQPFDSSDGVTSTGDPSMLVEAPDDSLSSVREAPYMVKASDGTYFLFYSTGVFSQSDYTVSYATGTSPTEPFTEQGALLQTGSPLNNGGTLLGPGGATLIPTGNVDEWYMAFHGLSEIEGPRPLYTAIVSIQDGKPVVQ